MAKTAKGNKWTRVSEYKRGNSIVRGHCRSTQSKKSK